MTPAWITEAEHSRKLLTVTGDVPHRASAADPGDRLITTDERASPTARSPTPQPI